MATVLPCPRPVKGPSSTCDFLGTEITDDGSFHEGDGGTPSCPAPPITCLDPVLALDDPTCSSGGNPVTLRQIFIDPQVAETDLGSDFQFRAWMEVEDGRRSDITDQAVWASAVPSIAASRGVGIFNGASVGSADVTATWRGKSASARLRVLEGCRDVPLDLVVVVESGAGWGSKELWDAVLNASLSLRIKKPWSPLGYAPVDRFAVVGFGATAFKVVDWSQDWSDYRGGLTYLGSGLPSPTNTPGTSIGRGLQYAASFLDTKRPNARPVVMLATSGLENNCDPPAAGMAGILKSTYGALVAVLGLRRSPMSFGRYGGLWPFNPVTINSGDALVCASGGIAKIPVKTFLDALGTPGFVWYPDSFGSAGVVMNALPRNSCVYYYSAMATPGIGLHLL